MKRAAALVLAALLAGCVSGPDERPRPAPAATATAPGYVVRPGDTLSGIGARLGIDMAALARANALAPPYLIRVGQRLAIPARRAAMRSESRPVVQPLPRSTPAATPAPVPTSTPTTSAATIARAPRLAWPADGPVSVPFSNETRGLSISAHAGAAVRAAAAGTVLFAGDEPQRFGKLVLVDHGGGWVSAYGRVTRIVVREGEALRSGARLGFVGDGGLHFELRRDNAPVDPLPLLPPRF